MQADNRQVGYLLADPIELDPHEQRPIPRVSVVGERGLGCCHNAEIWKTQSAWIARADAFKDC